MHLGSWPFIYHELKIPPLILGDWLIFGIHQHRRPRVLFISGKVQEPRDGVIDEPVNWSTS